jgi:circadian clock protein KaiC
MPCRELRTLSKQRNADGEPFCWPRVEVLEADIRAFRDDVRAPRTMLPAARVEGSQRSRAFLPVWWPDLLYVYRADLIRSTAVRMDRVARKAPQKCPTEILGFDEVTHGGLPRGRTTLVFGGPGCGKTVLALQVLVNGARRWRESGVFVAFEESSEAIVANAASFGWDLPRLMRRKLFFLNAALRPDVVHAGEFDLSGLLSSLALKVRDLKAKRIVFDGVDVLLALLNNPATERAELHRLHSWIAAQGLTGIVTAKAESDEPFSQARYAFAAYMADCALLLTRRHADSVSERELSILKYRGSAFAENKAPFVIGSAGIEVAEQGSRAEDIRPTTQRVTSGVPRLDTMLDGGYLRRSSVLITGLPGTAKTSLSGAFIYAALQRDERALYVSFDEDARETVRNLASIGIRLEPFVQSGRLRMTSPLSLSDNAEVQLMRIRATAREQGATCLVVDPISALGKSSKGSMSLGALARFILWSKSNGLTALCTSLLASHDPHLESAELGVSTLCDTWIHLAYAQHGGERNRSITVIKSRGSGHSNQVRELTLSNDGITLADVYQAGGEVYMGTLRWEKENAERDAQRRMEADAVRHRLELERVRAELLARAELVQRELAVNKAELADTKRVESDRILRAKRRQAQLLVQRGADTDHEPRGRGSTSGSRSAL